MWFITDQKKKKKKNYTKHDDINMVVVIQSHESNKTPMNHSLKILQKRLTKFKGKDFVDAT